MTSTEKAARYCQQSEALFECWKQKEPCEEINHREEIFVRDGVVCPDIWFSQQIRPLYLLKEAYSDPGDPDWSLVSYLLAEESVGKHTTWKRISEWTQGLFHTTATPVFPYSKVEKGIKRGDPIYHQIAVMNVRKSGGKKNSKMNAIRHYAETDQKELLEQITLIDPTMIVCGYTISCLNIILGKTVKDYARPETFSADLFFLSELNGHPLIALDYWHPSNQFPDMMNYYGLMGSYQQALQAAQ